MFFQVVVFCCHILLSHFITDVCSCLAQDKQLPARFLHGSGAVATFTTEQFGELVASMMALSQALSANAQIVAAMTPSGGSDRRDRGSRKLSMKAFNRVTKFAQGEAQWKEFHFDFGVLIGAEYTPLLGNCEGCGADDGRDRHADGESSRMASMRRCLLLCRTANASSHLPNQCQTLLSASITFAHFFVG